MEKLILDISSPEQDTVSTASMHCYALVGPDRMSYLISNQTNQILALKTWQIDANGRTGSAYLKEICRKDAMLSKDFQEVRIGIQNKVHTIVPNRMFDPVRLPQYFHNLLPFGKSYRYAFDDLPAFDAKLVYGIEEDLAEVLEQNLPKGQQVHGMTAYLEAARSYCNASTYNVFLNVYNHYQQILVFDGQELLFFNTYSFSSPSDFVYFLLLPLEQLKIEPASTSIVVSGEITEDSECLRVARRFVGPFRFMQLPPIFDYPGSVQSLPSHFCFDLYSLKLKK